MRFEPAMLEAIDQAAKDGGFASPSSFIRQAVVNQLQGASKALNDTEERILATLERQSRDIRKLTTAAVLSYASLDTFIKLYLTYQPEISTRGEECQHGNREAAVREVQGRCCQGSDRQRGRRSTRMG